MDLVNKFVMRVFVDLLKDAGVRKGDVFNIYDVKRRSPINGVPLTVDYGSGESINDVSITYTGGNDKLIFNQAVVTLLLSGEYKIVIEKATKRCPVCEGENPLGYSEDFKYCHECGKRLF